MVLVVAVLVALAVGVFAAWWALTAAARYQRRRVLRERFDPARLVAREESRVFRSGERYADYCARARRNGLEPCSLQTWLTVMSAGRPDGTWDDLAEREQENRS